jgi:protein-L-isoaspartate O-methyltransferase
VEAVLLSPRTSNWAEELTFQDEAAAEYDRAFAHVPAYFMPFLLRAAHVAPGMRVLDIATGTGLSAEAALAAVGPTRHVTAADISSAMVRKAAARLGNTPNVSVIVEDGQNTEGVVLLTLAQLSMLTEGIDWRAPLRTWQPELAG